MAHTREKVYYAFISRECFQRNRKNDACEAEGWEINYTLINKSSAKTKRDGRIYL